MPVYFQSTGVEELVDEIETVLIRDVNDALETVYNRREAADTERAARRNIPFVPIEYDEVPPEHFHVGNFPSLALDEVPLEAYPYIVITIEDFLPDAENSMEDHRNVYRDAVVIHCLSQASLDEGSEVVWRRAVRMGEAVFISLMSEPTLQNRLANLGNPVRGRQSIPWKAPISGHGDDWWYQSCGMQFAVKSVTTMYQ
jgi:hypothetical protein